MIAAIVARSRNGVIGDDNTIPWNLPDDMKYFRHMTRGHAVLMGRKTAESIINHLGHGLPDRKNIVLTRDPDYKRDDFNVVHTLEQAMSAMGPTGFIIGGEQIYWLTLPFCDRLYITEVDTTVDGDARFPDINPDEWREVARESHHKDDKNDHNFDFVVYDRIT